MSAPLSFGVERQLSRPSTGGDGRSLAAHRPEVLPAEIELWLDRLSHDRQHDLRGMLGVVVDALVRHCQLAVHAKPAASVRIAVVVRKVRAGDLEPDAMAGLEQVAGRPDRNVIGVDLAGLDRLQPLETLSEYT